jgi:prephenate dehydrogenase
MENKVVSVYGYGRFGRLWADILSDNFQVKVYSRRGLTRDEVPDYIDIATKESIFDCDAMFFCVAISAFEDVLKHNQHLFKTGTIYFDTSSVKVYPAQWMQQYIPDGAEIIATHPMFGPDSYYSSERPLPIVMSDIHTRNGHFGEWTEYFSRKNMRVEEMSPDEHDKQVAYSQGITHYVGRVLADLNLEPKNIGTLGYQKLLEIIDQTCNDSWLLFTDLQRYNPYTKKMRQDLHQSLEKIYGMLDE